jgi:phosphate/sulfate permease
MKSLFKRINAYIFNPSVRLQDRSFVVFSLLVLIALYAAVPFGMVMKEPVSATVSTLIGAVVFLYMFIMCSVRIR